MALVNCPDCGKEVSSNAPTCPGCGAPIREDKESTGSGVQQLQTIQETSKKFKIQSILSLTIFFIGMFFMMITGAAPEAATTTIGGWLLTIGLIWYLVNRFRIWWHHK